VDYPSWLANPVFVEKPDKSWRMCINYTSLNKVCPKDEYPLPRICQIVDSTTSCELLSFLDAYSGYHQISLAIDDEAKQRLLCRLGFSVTPRWRSSLKMGELHIKNVYIVLEGQIGWNVEAYIDDIVVKSEKHGDLLDDLKETFDNPRKFKMMLNPKKCIFGVSSGKLLGYMVSSRGIDGNSKKVETIKKLQPPRTRKEI
jgi:hypothetical protein